MSDAIFLSASVPDPKRAPHYAETADTVAITSAVSALVHVVLGRRLLVWGGHPAITPMIWTVAEEMGLDYGGWVRLHQSRFFQDEFPEDNEKFQNVVYSDAVPDDREASLLRMREQMFLSTKFAAAVFIGGMEGILAEFELFQELQPSAVLLPVLSTGGATLALAERTENLPSDLSTEYDYISLFHRHLDVSVREKRFRRPNEQPARVEERFWKAGEPSE